MENIKSNTLRKRLAPSVPLMLELADDSGSVFTRNFKLSFDFNAISLVEDRTGFSLLTGEIWKHMSAKTVSFMLWAAILANHPEYESEDGLLVIRSYMDAGNADKVMTALLDAFIASLPKEKQEQMQRLREVAVAEENPTPEPTTVA